MEKRFFLSVGVFPLRRTLKDKSCSNYSKFEMQHASRIEFFLIGGPEHSGIMNDTPAKNTAITHPIP